MVKIKVSGQVDHLELPNNTPILLGSKLFNHLAASDDIKPGKDFCYNDYWYTPEAVIITTPEDDQETMNQLTLYRSGKIYTLSDKDLLELFIRCNYYTVQVSDTDETNYLVDDSIDKVVGTVVFHEV